MKGTFLLVMSFLIFQSVKADDFTYLNVQKTDGTGVSLELSDLSITFSDGLFMAGDTQIALTDLSKMFFSDEEMDSQAVYESITLGDSGKTTYCSDESLDFSAIDNVKAFVATGFDKDQGIIWLTRVTKVPAETPVLLKGDANSTFEVPVLSSSLSSYYKNMLIGNLGSSITIDETEEDGAYVNYYLKNGEFTKVNGSATVGENKCYLRLPAAFNTAHAGSSQSVTIGSTGKATYAPSVDVDFTNVDGLKAFTATGYEKNSNTVWLTRVFRVQAGEGVLLKGDAGDYEIPSEAVQSNYSNMFVGNISGESLDIDENDGDLRNYYLSEGTFVSVNGTANIGNGKCYLQLPVSFASLTRGSQNSTDYGLSEQETIQMKISTIAGNMTGINETIQTGVEQDVYYNLQGMRVDNPTRGIYIRNGKKVVIK
ncbi:MAG: hypothetical protein IJJ56_06660 [Prevotella sp.]|mgnify:CR=1 FL=1|nr:hypothetical protein [Prevotella sp.]